MYALRFKPDTTPNACGRAGQFISEIRSNGHTGLCDLEELDEKGGVYSFVEDAAAALVRALMGGAGRVWDLRSVEIVEILDDSGKPTPFVLDGVVPIPAGSTFGLALRGDPRKPATGQDPNGWLTINGLGGPLKFLTVSAAAVALERYTKIPGGNPFSIMVVPPEAPSVRVLDPSEVYG